MLISFKRVFRIGSKSFFRNIGLTVATIFVMSAVVFLITMLYLFNSASQLLISDIQGKVDVSVYFCEDALVEEIMEVKSAIAQISEVKEVEYISKEQALEVFIEKHKNDPVLMESLTEVGKNPFFASLSIKTEEASNYEEIVKFLEEGSFNGLIEKVDYYERKPVIDKVFSITRGVNRAGIAAGIVLVLIAVLVLFNTIRMAIYSLKEEVSVMKLVGASNWFIRGPFLIQGILAGLITVIIVLLITFGVVYGFNEKIKVLAPNISVFNLFVTNFWPIFFLQLVTGVGLGAFSSFIAIRKYLKK